LQIQLNDLLGVAEHEAENDSTMAINMTDNIRDPIHQEIVGRERVIAKMVAPVFHGIRVRVHRNLNRSLVPRTSIGRNGNGVIRDQLQDPQVPQRETAGKGRKRNIEGGAAVKTRRSARRTRRKIKRCVVSLVDNVVYSLV
jgi:hypothetical protein